MVSQAWRFPFWLWSDISYVVSMMSRLSLFASKKGDLAGPPGDTILVLLKDVERPVADQPVAEILTIVALDPTRNAVDDSD